MQSIEKLSLIHQIFEENSARTEGSPLEDELRQAVLEDFYKNKNAIENKK